MKAKTQYKISAIGDRKKERAHLPIRYVLAVILSAIEVVIIIGVVIALCYFVPCFYLLAYLTQIGCVLKLISSDDSPDYKVPWLLFLLILPIVGFMLYFMFYSRKLQKKYVKRLNRLNQEIYPTNDEKILEKLKEEDVIACSHAKMLCNLADAHIFENTSQTYFSSGEEMFQSMLSDIKNAKHFIYMEYFIIEEGKLWNCFLSELCKKSKSGVEVKLVYDDIGCMKTLPNNYLKKLETYQIQVASFSRLKGSANSEFNNRNHRKITIIDGVIGYTGGVNIADEYINEKVRFGHWKDGGVRLKGEAVYELTKLFTVDFGISVKSLPTYHEKRYPKIDVRANGYVIPFGDGPRPVYNRRVSKSVIQNMLSVATSYVYITTPYLIVDNELCMCLENTALRGVNVKIILPHIPDKKLVFSLSRSFYSRLISAGVQIYEYKSGFVHCKNYIVDGKFAMIGTVNLDYRSLVHHFENGVWMYKTDCITDAETDFNNTLKSCVKMTPEMVKINPIKRFLRSIVKIFAPLF